MTLIEEIKNKILQVIGRTCNYYDTKTGQHIYIVENEDEALVFIGTIKDHLVSYNVKWEHTRPTLWVGLEGRFKIALWTQYKNGQPVLCIIVE